MGMYGAFFFSIFEIVDSSRSGIIQEIAFLRNFLFLRIENEFFAVAPRFYPVNRSSSFFQRPAHPLNLTIKAHDISHNHGICAGKKYFPKTK